jgi:FixJ family two-component response regulator
MVDLQASGLKGFVQKPFNFARLGRAVRQALDE